MQQVCNELSNGCASLCGVTKDVAGKAGEGLSVANAQGKEAMGLLGTTLEMLCHPLRFISGRPLGLYVLITTLNMIAEIYYGVYGLMSPRLQRCGVAFTAIALLDACFAPVHVLFAWYCSGKVMAKPQPEPLIKNKRTSAVIADEVLHHTNNLIAHDRLFAFYFMSWVCCFIVNFGVFTQMDKCRDTDFGSTITGLMIFQMIFGLIYFSLWYMVLACGCVSCCSCIFVFEAPLLEDVVQQAVAPYIGRLPSASAPPLQQGGLGSGGP